MAERILITCTDSMMKQFLEPHVIHLVENGYDVEIACSDVLGRFQEVQEDLGSVVKTHRLSLQRSPLAFPAHMKGYRELKQIIRAGCFDLIWTNEPVMSTITRLAAQEARKNGTRVLYMCHGFHFYKGASIANWLLFYPIERTLANEADCICTINREDCARAQKMFAGRVEYIHGTGVDTRRLYPKGETDLRKEIRAGENAFIILTVGELNRNKNQQVILKAIAVLEDKEIHYVLCGKGDQRARLERMSRQFGMGERVHFLGYRKDLSDIYHQADVFAMTSKREGLSLASLEAMYCGLPLLNSGIGGLLDISENGTSGYVYSSDDVHGFAEGIKRIKESKALQQEMGRRNRNAVEPYRLENTKAEILHIISSVLS